MDYLESLNEEQKEAVLKTEGPLLVLAGAGSGKTRVLTHKIAHLIEDKGVNPWNVLSITFTNKAAEEMKERVSELLDKNVDGMWMGTFHSIGVRILRRNIEKIGYNSSFTIYDRDDQITLVKEIIKDMNLNSENFKENSILSYIGQLKNDMVSAEEFMDANYKDFIKQKIGEIYKTYQKRLKEYNALDFDDLIIKTVEVLMENKDVLEYYQDKFKYVLVDEYQDTNGPQYKMVRLLSGKHNNVTIVGDGDQSIYGWRGADIRNILDFERDYENSETILLEQNYRSTSNILNLANEVIQYNRGRRDKNLWTSQGEGDSVEYSELRDEREEAEFVVNKIEELYKSGRKLSDFAILYRTNAQSRVFEELFMAKSIPYKLVGGLKFYDRKEIKDIVSYLRILENPIDNISMKRIINTPTRGIGNATIGLVEDHAEKRGWSLYESLKNLDEIELSNRARNSLGAFVDIMEELQSKKEELSIAEYIEEVIKTSGYLERLEKDDTIESKTRIDNMMEFVSVAMTFEMEYGTNSLEEFLETVALLSDIDKTEEGDDVVTLMTVHSSKGLEFPVVFVVGMEEGMFPNFRSLESESEIEEERRLCYVGVTRAEEKLFITGAKIRTIYGRTNYSLPSRFIKEMGDYLVQDSSPFRSQPIITRDYTSPKKSKRSQNKISFGGTNLTGMPSKPKAKTGNKDLDISIGSKVEHKKWGEGMVVQIKERPDGDKEVTIAFEEDLKKLLLSLAPIKILR